MGDCGGFELITCKANSRDLSVLNCSFTSCNIKSRIGGGQGKIYIRPIQRNIELKDSVEIDVSKLKQKCFTCGEEVLIKDLRKHVYSHEPLNLLSDDNSEYESGFPLPDPFGQSVSEGNTLKSNETFPANNANDTTTRDLHLNTSENNENSNQEQVQSQTNQTSSLNDNNILNQDTDNTETGSVPPIENDVLKKCIETEKIKQICKARELVNPVQILKVMQEHLVKGRSLEVEDPTSCDDCRNLIIFYSIQIIFDI